MVNVGIIIGSTRPGRFAPQPGNWLFEIAQGCGDARYELIDLKEVDLPLLDEPVPPLAHQYQHEHTTRWSQRIAALDGYVFVTAEYNHGIPAALKNAIDFLYHEWNFKPAVFLSYGAGPEAGSRAVEHLRGVMAEIKVYDLREQVLLPGFYGRLNDRGEYPFSTNEAAEANGMLEQLIFWAGAMKEARTRLSS